VRSNLSYSTNCPNSTHFGSSHSGASREIIPTRPVPTVLGAHEGESLPGGVADNVAARHLVGRVRDDLMGYGFRAHSGHGGDIDLRLVVLLRQPQPRSVHDRTAPPLPRTMARRQDARRLRGP
jgi:hypothetical protein